MFNYLKLKKNKNYTYIIAEIGINHGGNLKVAMNLIKAASRTGVDAVKFQTYNTELRVKDKKSDLFYILKKCELQLHDFKTLKDYAFSKKLDFISTPFDFNSSEYLYSINTKIVKIASFDVINMPFLRHIKKTHKNIIFSTGMSNLNEIKKAYSYLKNKENEVSILHCISSYPLNPHDANLNNIKCLQDNFKNSLIGYSDHFKGNKVSELATGLGIRILEKHFMLNGQNNCVDFAVSSDEKSMKQLVNNVRDNSKILGNYNPALTTVQKPIKK
ncbi:N-acetylneuraminate synthase family protein, partial [Alphaproteobacteria bacterium]|nr:N-acetylneuraminate synthase family protein [Alphaproteobacteria bacterium]